MAVAEKEKHVWTAPNGLPSYVRLISSGKFVRIVVRYFRPKDQFGPLPSRTFSTRYHSVTDMIQQASDYREITMDAPPFTAVQKELLAIAVNDLLLGVLEEDAVQTATQVHPKFNVIDGIRHYEEVKRYDCRFYMLSPQGYRIGFSKSKTYGDTTGTAEEVLVEMQTWRDNTIHNHLQLGFTMNKLEKQRDTKKEVTMSLSSISDVTLTGNLLYHHLTVKRDGIVKRFDIAKSGIKQALLEASKYRVKTFHVPHFTREELTEILRRYENRFLRLAKISKLDNL